MWRRHGRDELISARRIDDGGVREARACNDADMNGDVLVDRGADRRLDVVLQMRLVFRNAELE